MKKSSKSASIISSFLYSMSSHFILLRYVLTSATIAAIDYLVFMIFFSLGQDVLSSVLIARVAAMLINFGLLQKRVFFYLGKVSPALIKYVLLVFAAGLVTTQLIHLFTYYFTFNVIIAKAAAELMLYFINFFIIKKYIFVDIKVSRTVT